MASNTAKVKAEKAALKADLEQQLKSGTVAQLDKLQASKAHLIGQLSVAAEKYRTVNGYMQARQTVEAVVFGNSMSEIQRSDTARDVATRMAGLAKLLADKIEKLDVMDIDESVLDGLLDKDFIDTLQPVDETAMQLLVVNLLQNVGPSLDDIVSFREMTEAELGRISAELAELGHVPSQTKLEAIEGGAN